jgi:FAD/FMN-containing dehydrogenase
MTMSGGARLFSREAVVQLNAQFRGPLLLPGSDGYEHARRVWNTRFDRRPALIARCTCQEDVVAAVNFARAHSLHPAVRGGGHGDAGHAVCDDDLMIDLSLMRSVRVDTQARRARAGGGATWADLDRETQRHSLAVPGSTVSHVGIGGVTLGGGFGYLNRRYGLSADNLASAEIVTADGRLRVASPTEHPDLFWALRGGGGNFGVVTSFEYDLHQVGPVVLGGMLFHPYDRAREALRFYREVAPAMPDDLYASLTIASPPRGALPLTPHLLDGPIIVLVICWHGDDSRAGDQALRRLRELAPAVDTVRPIPYIEQQQMFDTFAAPAAFFRRSGYLDELSDDAIDLIVRHADREPAVRRLMDINIIAGAVATADGTTACGGRAPGWLHQINAIWDWPADETRTTNWVRSFYGAIEPLYAHDRVYVNHLGADEEHRVRQAYANGLYERLAEVKRRYDPHNLFRRNHNIVPP